MHPSPAGPPLLPVGVAVAVPGGGAHLAVGPEVLVLDAGAARLWAAVRQGSVDLPAGADQLRARGFLAAPPDATSIRLVPHSPVPPAVSVGPGRALEEALWTWSAWDPSLHDVVLRLLGRAGDDRPGGVVAGSALLDPATTATTTAMAAWSAVARWVVAGSAHLDTALACRPVRSW